MGKSIVELELKTQQMTYSHVRDVVRMRLKRE